MTLVAGRKPRPEGRAQTASACDHDGIKWHRDDNNPEVCLSDVTGVDADEPPDAVDVILAIRVRTGWTP
jgi:hypothetical protein